MPPCFGQITRPLMDAKAHHYSKFTSGIDFRQVLKELAQKNKKKQKQMGSIVVIFNTKKAPIFYIFHLSISVPYCNKQLNINPGNIPKTFIIINI